MRDKCLGVLTCPRDKQVVNCNLNTGYIFQIPGGASIAKGMVMASRPVLMRPCVSLVAKTVMSMVLINAINCLAAITVGRTMKRLHDSAPCGN